MHKTTYPTIWFDMDGVAVVYIMDDYLSGKWQIPNSHYFLNQLPDENACRLIELTHHQYPNVNLITNITQDPAIMSEHIADKRQWIADQLPYLKEREIHLITQHKADYVQQYLNRRLRPSDILISDYHKDLTPWQTAGGTTIKYLNGINSPTDQHHCLSWREAPLKSFQQLQKIIREVVK